MQSADGIPYAYILDLFEKCPEIDETTFYFSDEEPGPNHYLGYLPGPEENLPYWAGYCNLEDGFDCATAEELFSAPYYDGKSLKERWDKICFYTIGMIASEDFIRIYRREFPIEEYKTGAEYDQKRTV